MYKKQSAICTTVDAGVERPIKKRELVNLLISQQRGSLTQNAPTIPWIITKAVQLQPLKYPIKQNKNAVKRQSIAYALRHSHAAIMTGVSFAKIPARRSPLKKAKQPITAPARRETTMPESRAFFIYYALFNQTTPIAISTCNVTKATYIPSKVTPCQRCSLPLNNAGNVINAITATIKGISIS